MTPAEEAERDILVVGGGHFGRLAVERLGRRVVLVAEPRPDPDMVRAVENAGALFREDDGISLLKEVLATSEPPKYIVPALPLHLAGEWLARVIPGLVRLPAPDLGPEVGAPLAIRGENGILNLSLADFRCPDDCPEPAGRCTVTGEPRGEPLFSRLERAAGAHGLKPAVLRSRQLAPGVGGLLTAELLDLAERLKGGGKWLLATACKCHGVAETMEIG